MIENEIIFTRHSRERLEQRKITKEMVISAIEVPDKFYMESDGNTKFIRTVNGRKVFVVCQPLLEERKWLVKSVWVRGDDNEGNIVPYKGHNKDSQNQMANYLYLLLALVLLGLTFAVWYFGRYF